MHPAENVFDTPGLRQVLHYYKYEACWEWPTVPPLFLVLKAYNPTVSEYRVLLLFINFLNDFFLSLKIMFSFLNDF